jgi:hypothetical protein
MIIQLVPLNDSTIYEDLPNKNTGLDEILELNKTIVGSQINESRILMYVPTTNITDVLTQYNVPSSSLSCSLKLYTVQETEIPLSYNITVAAVSGSWTNGTGKLADVELTGGVSWIYSAGESNNKWVTSSFTPDSTGSYTVPGGGNWYTNSIVSQSFSFKEDNDLNIDITPIVIKWLSNEIPNDGIIIRFENVNAADILVPTNIQFYSSDTHTVYSPQIQLKWTGSIEHVTGSLQPVTLRDNPVLYTIGARAEYKPNTVNRVFLGSRPMYPKKSFSQNPSYQTIKYIPIESYYRIVDASTNDVIVDYSEFTQISCDTESNYFDFSTSGLYPERFYKFEFKLVFGEMVNYYDYDYLFKIIR